MPTTKKATTKKSGAIAPKVSTPKKATTKKPKRVLAQASGPQCFWVTDGSIIANLAELRDLLGAITNEVFKHHVTKEKNDFADWVEFVLGDRELAQALRKIREPKSARIAVVTRLRIYDL